MAYTAKQRRAAQVIWRSEAEYQTVLDHLALEGDPDKIAHLKEIVADQKAVMDGIAAKFGLSLADAECLTLRQTELDDIKSLHQKLRKEKQDVIQAKEDFLKAYGVANPDDLERDQVKWGLAMILKNVDVPQELVDLLTNWTNQKKQLKADIVAYNAMVLKAKTTPAWST
jgi:hypothetical protein